MKKTLIASTIIAAASFMTAIPAVAEQDAAQFNAHKQKLLGNLGEHIAKMQKKQACINDATDEKALSACFSANGDNVHRDGNAPGKQ